MCNLSFQIFNKTGTSLFGPAANNTLWAGFGGPCQTENSGDPVVLYDKLANRWFLSQFTSAGPNYFFCVAISQTADPTGAYFRYAISTGTNFPDYPKAAVWPDAYYISTREFAGARVRRRRRVCTQSRPGNCRQSGRADNLVSRAPGRHAVQSWRRFAPERSGWPDASARRPAQLLCWFDGQQWPLWRTPGCPDLVEVHRQFRYSAQLQLRAGEYHPRRLV